MDSMNTVEQLTSQTVIVSLNLGKPGNSKKVNQSEIEVLPSDEDGEKPNQEKLRVSKVLLDSQTLKDIGHIHNSLRKWLASQCLPTKFIKRGMGIIKATNIPKVEAKFLESQTQVETLVSKFEGEYDKLVTESFAQLGALAKVEDYPTLGEILQDFEFGWNYLTFDTPRKVLGTISADMVKAEEEKLAKQMGQIVGEVEAAHAQLFSGMVEYLLDHLDGKKKVSEKFIDKYNNFFSMFKDQDLGTDGKLTQLVEQARDLINGVSPDEINTQGNMRDFVKSKMDEIKAAIDLTIVEQGERYISLPKKKHPVIVNGTANQIDADRGHTGINTQASEEVASVD